MSLEKANIPWSAKQVKNNVLNGKVDFNHIVQRGYAWEKWRKSAFIESLILGYPFPPIYAKKIETENEKKYAILDGKQRLSTIKEFLNNEFALTVLPPVSYLDEATNEYKTCDISNMKFSDLPEALQDHLNTVSITVIYFENLTKEEEREMFKRLNAGKPLSTKSRLLASCKDIEGLLDIGSHMLFNEMLTNKAKDNKNQVALVMKAWCMLNQDIENISFESIVFNPMLEKVSITEEEKEVLVEVFDLIVLAHDELMNRDAMEKKVAKKLYTETHLISLVPFFKQAVDDDIATELLADWLVSFYNIGTDASVSEEYNTACAGGSAKHNAIVARHNALESSYKEFFSK